ncbi:triglyceride lipase ATG15 [Rhodotorula paludigena]|uniref:triglyceride lipase ATG15 n=1 Tax=Rhodotorula paludigena TaxID=86838 RepID=UPI00317CA0E5
MLLVPPIALAAVLPLCAALQIPFHARPGTPPTSTPSSRDAAPSAQEHTLSLRHAVHFSTTHRHLPPSKRDYSTFELAALDAQPDVGLYSSTQSIRTKRVRARRPNSQEAFQAARRASYWTPLRAMQEGRLPTRQEVEDTLLGQTLEWEDVEIDAPDVKDVATLAAFGKMTSNAYTLPDSSGWYDIGGGWNVSDSFGWQEDGMRGHVFADEQNKTVVIAIKGTSALIVGGGGGTAHNDKTNDNLFFSCCCARVDWSWSTVCDCFDSSYTCREDCVEHAVMTKSAYYPVATDLYNNVSALYPHAQIWLAGHSLGGAIAAMLSRTYGVPSISFESPGDLLPARRLHLPLPPANHSRNATHPSGGDKSPARSLDDELTTHVFHTADPIANGQCRGTISTCGIAGFALESKCHTGKSIKYDTVGRLGWSTDIRTHPIHVVIEKLLIDDWGVKPDEVAAQRAGGDEASSWFGWWPGRGSKKPSEDDGGKGAGEGGDKDEEEDDGQNGGKGVPEPHFEDETCSDCSKWTFI